MNPENPSTVFECDRSCGIECLNCRLSLGMYHSKARKLQMAFRANINHVAIQEEKIRVAQRTKERFEANIKANKEDLKVLQDNVNRIVTMLQDSPELLRDTRIKDSILKMKFE
jgi:hypothetical protein